MHIKNPPPWKSYTVTKTNYQGMDTIMIFNWNSELSWSYEIAPILEALFRYIDSLSLPETPYVTGRPLASNPINRRNSEKRKDAYGQALPVIFENKIWPMAVWTSPRDGMGI
jgi:hypothetical protein